MALTLSLACMPLNAAWILVAAWSCWSIVIVEVTADVSSVNSSVEITSYHMVKKIMLLTNEIMYVGLIWYYFLKYGNFGRPCAKECQLKLIFF